MRAPSKSPPTLRPGAASVKWGDVVAGVLSPSRPTVNDSPATPCAPFGAVTAGPEGLALAGSTADAPGVVIAGDEPFASTLGAPTEAGAGGPLGRAAPGAVALGATPLLLASGTADVQARHAVSAAQRSSPGGRETNMNERCWAQPKPALLTRPLPSWCALSRRNEARRVCRPSPNGARPDASTADAEP